MAEHSPPVERARWNGRTETSAWLILIGFFLVFCALVAAASFAAWRYYTGATVEQIGALVRVHAPAGVTYQAKGSTKSISPSTPCATSPAAEVCQPIREGERVRAAPLAGYGPVASITLPDTTQIDMYAYPTGADLTLDTYQVSRWHRGRQIVQLTQAAGYARYDIPTKDARTYAQVTYQVVITEGVRLLLSPSGSYSVDVPQRDKNHPPAIAPSGKPIMAEIAVRAGSVEVESPRGKVIVGPGRKVQIDTDRAAGETMPTRWELIRDGGFDTPCKTTANVRRCGIWQVTPHVFDPTVSKAEQNAVFTIYHGCGPETPAFCKENQSANIAQFYREGNQSKSYGIGISQTLDLDVSEYPSLRLSMWARVIKQTIPGAGIANIECPVTVELTYKQNSPVGDPEYRYICVYKDESSAQSQLPVQLPGQHIYQGVTPSAWFHLSYELRDWMLLPSARYLQRIRIYAIGHDYISEVTAISLVAAQ